MAGLSSRFFKAGFTIPKYKLPIGYETIFEWSVRSFELYFKTDKFVFIYRDIYDTEIFIKSKIKELGIKDYDLICLDNETEGQADTVYEGTKHIDTNDPIFIFNIDSKIEGFTKPTWIESCAGYIEVFESEGDQWSFVLPGEKNNVIRTTEKDRISDLCSDGLYFFDKLSTFKNLFLYAKENKLTTKGEYYVAPLYNILIEQGGIVRYDLIDKRDILFCGTPNEYNVMVKNISES